MEKITVNILGETQKEQWLNAIMIFEECIAGNGRIVFDEMCGMCERDCDECRAKPSASIVVEQTKVFADEMRRLVEGVFNEG